MKWKSSSKKRKRGSTSAVEPRAKRRPNLAVHDVDGRVRLVVAPNPEGGRPTWQLSAPLFDQAWQNALAESAANITVRSFEPNPTLPGAVNVAREAMKALGAMCDGWLSKDADRPVACASGCSHCCHQPVSVTPAEAFAIVHYLRQTRSEQDLAVLVERLEQRRAATEGLTRAQQYSPEYPCLFLVEGTCSIYDARPLVCRGMNSLDAEDCRRRMHDPEARQQFWREGGGECYLEPIEGAHAMTAGLQLGLTDVYGLDMQVRSLTDAMYDLLKDTELGRHWITGQPLPHDPDPDALRTGDGD